MELPSTRELELEALLRQRDKQVAELSDEITQLRQYLASQPGPSTTDPVTLPPSLISVLLPHIHAASAGPDVTAGSNTVTAALTQRSRLLQEENDELYDLLKQGETGKLKEEVRGLRRVVERLETALRESHGVITTISTELDKSYESFIASTRLNNALNSTKSYSQSPRASYHSLPQAGPTGNGTGMSKLPPTGPRAYKKPRLSEAQASPPPHRTNTAPPLHKSHSKHHPPARGHDTRDSVRRVPEGRGKPNHVKMDLEEDRRSIPPPAYDRERERDRDRERERGSKERDRDGGRERDGNRPSRRNSGFAGRGGGPVRRAERVLGPIDSFPGGDRTLAERMGL
ncbi:hypothetical protein L208DRAFT_1387118 [Tricholoma matsutake]|nr:hypothetical protein L208DRAFT_1387118 [Tricholoma matsutake 945]